jgi:hypothetical protein
MVTVVLKQFEGFGQVQAVGTVLDTTGARNEELLIKQGTLRAASEQEAATLRAQSRKTIASTSKSAETPNSGRAGRQKASGRRGAAKTGTKAASRRARP